MLRWEGNEKWSIQKANLFTFGGKNLDDMFGLIIKNVKILCYSLRSK